MKFKLIILSLFISTSCMTQSKNEISQLLKGTWEVEKIIIDGEEDFTTLSGEKKTSDMKIIFKDDKTLDFYQNGIEYKNLKYYLLNKKKRFRLNFGNKSYLVKVKNQKLLLIDDSLFITEYILKSL